MTVKITVIWNVTPYILVGSLHRHKFIFLQIEGYPSRCAGITILYLLSVVHNTMLQS